jgi:hypothetical protein
MPHALLDGDAVGRRQQCAAPQHRYELALQPARYFAATTSTAFAA